MHTKANEKKWLGGGENKVFSMVRLLVGRLLHILLGEEWNV
ncbi:hypothetical protein [Aeromonas media]|nr:hypothetical protein [Aeromonas media]